MKKKVSKNKNGKAQDALIESEGRFRSLVDNLPMNVFIIEPNEDATISFWNKHWLDFTGQTFEEALGRAWDGIVHLEDVQPILDVYVPAFQNRQPCTLPAIRIKRHDGVYRWFKVQANPRFLPNGEFLGYIGAGFEIHKSKVAADAIWESEQRFRNLVEQSPNPICIFKGEDMKLEVANEAVYKIWNVGKEVLGKPFLEIIPEMKDQPFMGYMMEAYRNGETQRDFEQLAYFIRENGEKEIAYFNFVYQPFREENGAISGVIAFATDVTEQVVSRKKIEEQDAKEKLVAQYARSLIEASLDPLITINTEGKITDMNEALATITGETREALLGTDFGIYFTDPAKAREIYREVFEKGFVKDYPLTIIDGEEIDVLFNGSVYKDEAGNVLGAVVVARIITEQKRIENELTEARVFAEMATAIAVEAKSKAETATAIAEDAVKSKQQFLSNMSHEIRTPMNAIIGFTKVVLKTDLSARQKEYLTAIKISGDSLIVLINDILDLAKVDAGKMTFEKTPFKMSLSISAVLHLFETKILEKNLRLVKMYDPKIPEVVVGDPVRLHQVILNLLSNAVKFTARGSITVSVVLLHENAEHATIEFSVSDTGLGIPEDKLESIFENFQQASSETARLFGGTGLGLAIVKQLVEPQGGSISVKSKVGEGSTFSFTLNFQKTNETVIETEIVTLDSEVKNIKVLVVEDMVLNQLLMKTILDEFGFERDIAENGKIAIEKLAAKNYDIILMDLQMPEMNGFEATEHIRRTMHSKIPIIALTADVTTVDLAKCRAAGMNDYIAKPVDERLLYNKIIELVKKPPVSFGQTSTETSPDKKVKYTDLNYLSVRTKSNPALMMEMISAYLEQTPPLISAMKQSFLEKNWELLHAAIHKMLPSFSIMGISADFETVAKKIQEYAQKQEEMDEMHELVLQLENVCVQACRELEEEFNTIKKTKR